MRQEYTFNRTIFIILCGTFTASSKTIQCKYLCGCLPTHMSNSPVFNERLLKAGGLHQVGAHNCWASVTAPCHHSAGPGPTAASWATSAPTQNPDIVQVLLTAEPLCGLQVRHKLQSCLKSGRSRRWQAQEMETSSATQQRSQRRCWTPAAVSAVRHQDEALP